MCDAGRNRHNQYSHANLQRIFVLQPGRRPATGLLDFPCNVDGRVVLLCWRMGETSITHWHGTEEGFAGRKPIDERIARTKRAN